MTIRRGFAYGCPMLRTLRFLILALGLTSAFASAQEPAKGDATSAAKTTPAVTPASDAAPNPAPAAAPEPASAPPVATGPALSAEELTAAIKIDLFSIPTPGELMAAVNKLGKPDWAAAIRAPITVSSFTSRPQMALNIGGLIADGFLAVEAEDAQQVKNIGKDIIALAKPLGVQQEILNRGKSLTDFAERGQWDTLKEELEATQNEVKTALTENKDSDLIVLVTLGGWIRAIDAMSDYIGKHYSADGARLLRQPAVAQFLTARLESLPEKVRDDFAVRKAKSGLGQIERAVSFPSEKAPTVEEVQELAKLSQNLLKEIASKKKKK
jgi:hypothetical protein